MIYYYSISRLIQIKHKRYPDCGHVVWSRLTLDSDLSSSKFHKVPTAPSLLHTKFSHQTR